MKLDNYIQEAPNKDNKQTNQETTKKVITFDIWGEYAHFKKNYSTTSSLTYNLPPRHTIAGLIGAILGIKRRDFPVTLSPENCEIGVSLQSAIEKRSITMNFIYVKSGFLISSKNFGFFRDYTQIPMQFLFSPKYRIYFSSKNTELFNKLEKMLREHKSYYTPSLGLSNLLCDFCYVDTKEVRKILPEEDIELYSAIKMDRVAEIDIKRNKYIQIENNHRHLTASREATEYHEILYGTKHTMPLYLKPKTGVWEVDKGKYIDFI